MDVSARPWRVKFDGPCARCGRTLVKDEVAVWDRASRTMHCVACPVDEPAVPEVAPLESGVAGASARREHDRRRANREVRIRSKYGDRIGGLVLKMTSDPQSIRAWGIGARGEEKLAEALSGLDAIRVLHDRRVPGTRGNIDHIVVAAAGVFVVDAKHYEGLIEIRNRGWLFKPDYRLYVGRRDRSHLVDNMGWQVDTVLRALESVHLEPVLTVTPVLCFVDGEWPIIRPPTSYKDVRLESERSLRRLLVEGDQLGSHDVDRVAHALAVALPAK